jgi:hypothetical protein
LTYRKCCPGLTKGAMSTVQVDPSTRPTSIIPFWPSSPIAIRIGSTSGPISKMARSGPSPSTRRLSVSSRTNSPPCPSETSCPARPSDRESVWGPGHRA